MKIKKFTSKNSQILVSEKDPTHNLSRIKVKLHPNSSQEKIVENDEKFYEVWLKEKALDNKANKALEKKLKKYFGKSVKIISGFTSRIKYVEVLD